MLRVSSSPRVTGEALPVLRAAWHELNCRECRVTWKSWAQRLLGDRRGYTPGLDENGVAGVARE